MHAERFAFFGDFLLELLPATGPDAASERSDAGSGSKETACSGGIPAEGEGGRGEGGRGGIETTAGSGT